ncbi:MAG: hypothetical protein RMK52_10035 [Chitinophagales bacterium]|nr:hypothetical protein [Chitinophagales bacterium]MDW8394565.1 hypothetical protein [Chitinophagales bacterium]
MRLVVILASITVLHQCSPLHNLRCADATAQHWSGGIAGTHGIYYRIYFSGKQAEQLRFDSLWVEGRRIRAEAVSPQSGRYPIEVLANDYRGIRQKPDGTAHSDAVEAPPPIQTKAFAVLGAFVDGQRLFIPIDSFRQLKPLFYP